MYLQIYDFFCSVKLIHVGKKLMTEKMEIFFILMDHCNYAKQI